MMKPIYSWLAVLTSLLMTVHAHALGPKRPEWTREQKSKAFTEFLPKIRSAQTGLFSGANPGTLEAIVDSQCQYSASDLGETKDPPTYEINLSETILANKFCFRKAPANPRQLFDAGFDVDPSFVSLWTSDAIVKSLRDFGARNADRLPVDIDAYIGMNLRAADIWERLVRCEGGAEEARAAYAQARFRCDGMKEDITALHSNGLDFLRTAGFRVDLLQSQAPFDRDRLETHPLLMQVFAEILANWFPTESSRSGLRDWALSNVQSEWVTRFADNLMRLQVVLPLARSAPMGLWPAAQRVANRYYMAKAGVVANFDRDMIQQALDGVLFPPSLLGSVKGTLWALAPVTWIWMVQDIYRGVKAEYESNEPAWIKNTLGVYQHLDPADIVEEFRNLSENYGIKRKDLLKEPN